MLLLLPLLMSHAGRAASPCFLEKTTISVSRIHSGLLTSHREQLCQRRARAVNNASLGQSPSSSSRHTVFSVKALALAIDRAFNVGSVSDTTRFSRWHFQWWEPATRFSFLKPWGDAYGPVATGPGRGGAGFGAPQPSSYAPPRPMAAPTPAPAPRQAEQPYRSPSGSEGVAVGSAGGVDGVGSGGVNGGVGPAAAADVVVAPENENSGLLEENSKEMGDLEDIFSESV